MSSAAVPNMRSAAAEIVSPTSFDDLRLGRSGQFVVGRLLRFWDSRNIKKQGEFMGITLIFLDAQNSVIHGFIPHARSGHYRPGSKDNVTCSIIKHSISIKSLSLMKASKTRNKL